MPTKDDVALELARRHFEVEDGLIRIVRYSGSPEIESDPDEPIKLLEVNENTVPSGIMPLYFTCAPTTGITYPSVIVEVTPDEYDKLAALELTLPDGWSIPMMDIPKKP